ncbi:GD17908 [Drosophila simulans]|uniref:GD17908 n=1 Tax=Drosophila simulans TaxID=7240 RepID=B4NRV0_DROSI|nr:GD17908 [Drosophila simulans]
MAPRSAPLPSAQTRRSSSWAASIAISACTTWCSSRRSTPTRLRSCPISAPGTATPPCFAWPTNDRCCSASTWPWPPLAISWSARV